MRAMWKKGLRSLLYSVIIWAGMLAVMHVESPSEANLQSWKRPEHRQRNTWTKMYNAAVSVTGLRKRTVADQLREVMADDELGAANPFAHLSSDDALERLLSMKVKSFERQTLRSPSYRDESGYDLIHYQIHFEDGTSSSVLAYLESPVPGADDGVPEVRSETVMLMILTPKGERNELAVYRDGTLEETNLVMPEEGASLLAQRLDSGIPFLSVSR